VKLRPPTREERQLALLWGVAAASALLLGPFWLAVAPLLPACPFRAMTGIPCPTCGTTHAAIALMHGRLGAALAANPLMTMAGLGFLAGGAAAPVWAALRWPVPEIPAPLPRWTRAAIVAALLASWAFLIWRS
jgi:Protein of unknown function (DUF2752)